MSRFHRVLLHDSVPAQIIILTVSMVFYFLPELIIKIVSFPVLLMLAYILQKSIKPKWFVFQKTRFLYFIGAFIMVSSFNFIVSYGEQIVAKVLLFVWVLMFSILLFIIDLVSDKKCVKERPDGSF